MWSRNVDLIPPAVSTLFDSVLETVRFPHRTFSDKVGCWFGPRTLIQPPERINGHDLAGIELVEEEVCLLEAFEIG